MHTTQDPGDMTQFTAAVDRFTAAINDLKPLLKTPNHAKHILTTEEVMEQLGCSKSTIYNLIRRGKLTRVKLGSLTRFRAKDVEELVLEEG